MLSFLARRFLTLVGTVLAASLIVFLVLEVVPGDPALLQLGIEASQEVVDQRRAEMGLDRPAVVRYVDWIAGLLTLDFGSSFTYETPVGQLIAQRLTVTLPLACMALVVSTLIAIPLGMFAAANRNRAGDYGVMTFSQIGVAVPNFWFGILLILLFAVHWQVFDTGFPGWDEGLFAGLKALVLPAAALALGEAAILARITRSAVLETMREDYVRTARAKGLSRWQVMTRHVLRNALIPISTIVGLQFALLLAGSIIIEEVFQLPGLGKLLIQAIGQRDFQVIKNAVVLFAVLVVFVNFLVDALYAAIDPRPKQA